MKKRKNTVPKPQNWLYVPVRWLCCLIARAAFGLRVTGRENLPPKGPLLVLATHQGMMDFMLAFAALKGRKAQFVATQRQFRNPKLHWLYVRLGVIPKVQFHTDPRCVMNIFRVLREGGTVVLFPAGQTSMWGVPGAIAPSIAHLVKKAGATVCTLGLRGGFFTAPRFGGLHFGRTEARLERAFTPRSCGSSARRRSWTGWNGGCILTNTPGSRRPGPPSGAGIWPGAMTAFCSAVPGAEVPAPGKARGMWCAAPSAATAAALAGICGWSRWGKGTGYSPP